MHEDDWTEFYTLDVENRRRARRINKEVGVRYLFSRQEVQTTVALNLSVTGARLLLNESPRGETELTLQLANRVDVLARTVWEVPLAGGKKIAGVAFEYVSREQQLALESLVSELQKAA